MSHPIPNYDVVARALETMQPHGQFRAPASDEAPPDPASFPGELDPVLDERSSRVPEPVPVRTPAVIHYPKARDARQILSGIDQRDVMLGFNCRAIVVQNLGTNGFLYVPELNIYITSGLTPLATFNIPSGIEKISFVWHSAAFNVATPAPAAGQFATVWLFDEWVLPEVAPTGNITVTVAMFTALEAAQTSIAQNAASVAALAANGARKGASFYNDTGAGIAYLAFGVAAAVNNFKVALPPNGYYELAPETVFTGAINVIWSVAGAGNLRVTELF